MTITTKATFPLLAAMTLGLAACEEGQFAATTPATDQANVQAPAEARVEIQDVERADIFSSSELALWDGRPSLGGIWVAHPDVTDPERALIRNATNGQSTFGALFRRERNNPGPRIQLSSDAANALGIIAGQPTELSVIAVRREEVIIEPAPVPVAETETEPADGEAAVLADPTDATVEAPAEPPKRQGFFARLFGGGTAATADDAASDDEAASASPPDVETAPLDPVTTGAAAAIAAAEASGRTASVAAPSNVRPVRRAAAAAPAPTPAPVAEAAVAPAVVAPVVVAPVAPAPAPATLNSPFVQVGLFTVEANANAAATGLRQGGIVPTIMPGTNANGTFWRVLVGPMTDPSDQSEILGQVKALGYSDAFLVSN